MLAGGVLWWTACGPSTEVFVCSSDSECTGAGNGACQSNGYCAFPDADCDSGLRYGEYAGGGYSKMCVPVDEGSTSADPVTTTDTPLPTSPTTTGEPDPTTGTPQTSTDTTSGNVGDGSDTTDATTTGGTPTCTVLFEDTFDAITIPAHWTALGAGSVTTSGGVARFQLRTDPGTTALRHGTLVALEGSWLAVRIADLSPEDAVQAFLSFTTEDEADTVVLAVETGGTTLVGHHVDAASNDDLFSIPYDDAMPWLRLREHDGHVIFEIGAGSDAWETVYEADIDLRGTSGSMEFGGANLMETPDEEVIAFDDAIGCAADT